ncbi:MAG: transposase [Proteobacteria bacterium]|nr:transposase [Pseudomonadota bacterium]
MGSGGRASALDAVATVDVCALDAVATVVACVSVSLRTVERRFRVVSDRLGDPVERPVSLALVAPPGAFQVDFGLVNASLCGCPRSLSLLICSSAYSNGCAAVACQAQDTSNLFYGLESCFVQLGGVPPLIRFDNLAPAVSCFKSGRKKTDAFSRFELHQGFISEFCSPASGWEKGNVENKVEYIRERFFVPVPSAPSLGALNDDLALWCREDMRRPHYAKERLIADLFDDDRAVLLPLRPSFDFWETVAARTDKRGFVQFRNNKYFVNEFSALRSVVIRASVDAVEIFSEDGELLAAYDRCYLSGQWVQTAEAQARLLSHKLNALGYVGRPRDEGLALRDALRRVAVDDRQAYIRRFLSGDRLSDILCAIEAQRAPLFAYNALLQDTKDDGTNRIDASMLAAQIRDGHK